MTYILTLPILVLFASQVFAGPISPAPAGYRVIRATPDAFISALRSPQTKVPPGARDTSRLDKYFRLRSKRIQGSRVILEIIPHVPILTEQFPDSSTVRIELEQVGAHENTFDFNARIEALGGNWLKSTLHVEPSQAGSLLRLTLNGSSYPAIVNKAFVAAALRLGFVFNTPAEAIRDTEPEVSPAQDHQQTQSTERK